MRSLFLQPTQTRPFIRFESAEYHLYFGGQALPSDIHELAPASHWIQAFLETNPPYVHFEFEMYYYNNVFALFLHDIFRQTRQLKQHTNCIVTVIWTHETDDDFIEEEGQDFADMYPFRFKFRSRPPFPKR